MKTLLVLPPRPVSDESMVRFFKSIFQNLGTDDIELAIRCDGEIPSSFFGRRSHRFAVALYDNYDVVVFIETTGEFEESDKLASSRASVYRFDQSNPAFEPRLMPVNRPPRDAEYPFYASHVFNEVTRELNDQFYYFPYGYLFRYTGFGPINEFGLRIPKPLETYRKRAPNQKLIAVFGGSAGFSMYCLHDEMFSSKIEEELNHWSSERGLDMEFTVLNFAQHGNVVMNQMLTYLLFAQALKPDFVISHDGFNDLAYGQVADPGLISDFDICYQHNLEMWGAILHDGKSLLPADREEDGVRKALNSSQIVIEAYLSRKRQFERLVTSEGGRFIWGLQPFLLSKRALSAEEKLFEDKEMKKPHYFLSVYRNIPFLYEEAVNSLAGMDGIELTNLHKAFSFHGETDSLFSDFVHCSPKGDEIIANCYVEHIKRLLG